MKEKNPNEKKMQPWLRSTLRVIIYVGILVGLYFLQPFFGLFFLGFTFPWMMAFAISQTVYPKPKNKALGICSLVTILFSVILIYDFFFGNIANFLVFSPLSLQYPLLGFLPFILIFYVLVLLIVDVLVKKFLYPMLEKKLK